MTFTIAADPLPLRLDSGGSYRVGGTRVRLDTVIFAYNAGTSPEQIVSEFPTLDLADVHWVIGYYLRHRSEVDAYLKVRQAEADRLRHEIESQPHNKELREKLVARRNQSS
jgi:uncharacterized protein (DUF433 family)